MDLAYNLQSLTITALTLLAVVGAIFAIVHAVRQRKDAFTAAGKLTKPIWLGILVVSLLVIAFSGVIGFLGIIGVVAVCVYLVDVRPRVNSIQGGGSQGW